jgi:glycosyltransferase involved in cell wall biosynthesis
MKNGTAMEPRPLISVIMPTYNRAHTLPRAIRSVLAQTWENLELIIADDGSADNTRQLIAEIPDRRLRYLRNDVNRGAAAARNLGLSHARGHFIAFQDSDDEWLLDKLTLQMEALRSHDGAYGATFGGKLLYGRNPAGRFGDGLSDYRPHKAQSVRSGRITSQLLSQNLISPQALLVRSDVVRAAGPFDERLPNNEDWEFMLRLSMQTRILFTNRPVVVAYISGDSISRNRHSNALSFMAIMKKHKELFSRHPKVYAQKLFATARYLHQLGRYRAAQKYLLRAVRVHPWSARSWFRLLHARLSTATQFGTAGTGGARSGGSRPMAAADRSGSLAAPRLDAYASSRNGPGRYVQRADSR